MPDKPAWLSPRAAGHWDRLVSLMGEVEGWLRVVEADALAQYCQSYADFVELRSAVEAEGWTVATDRGGVTLNPSVRAMNAAQDRWLKGMANLGLSPADRARIEVMPSETKRTGFAMEGG